MSKKFLKSAFIPSLVILYCATFVITNSLPSLLTFISLAFQSPF
uniref:Uncharacterized protein n=1 Tax=Arundo donax TaxID=35708 RepID=A0A0A8ZUR3_ARUDO